MTTEPAWEGRPMFALDADVTVYWPDVRPCYEEPCHAEHSVSFTGSPLGRNTGIYGKWEPCVEIERAKARCERDRWPEQHRDDCAWCVLVAEETALRAALLNG